MKECVGSAEIATPFELIQRELEAARENTGLLMNKEEWLGTLGLNNDTPDGKQLLQELRTLKT